MGSLFYIRVPTESLPLFLKFESDIYCSCYVDPSTSNAVKYIDIFCVPDGRSIVNSGPSSCIGLVLGSWDLDK